MLAGIALLTEMGFSVAVGIVISAFVMSMFLVPSVTALLGERAWWPRRDPPPRGGRVAGARGGRAGPATGQLTDSRGPRILRRTLGPPVRLIGSEVDHFIERKHWRSGTKTSDDTISSFVSLREDFGWQRKIWTGVASSSVPQARSARSASWLGREARPSRRGRPARRQRRSGLRSRKGSFELMEATIAEIHDAYRRGRLTCRELVQQYLDRIAAYDKQGPALKAIITVNPRALEIADDLDRRYRRCRPDRPAARHPDHPEGQLRHLRHADHRRQQRHA